MASWYCKIKDVEHGPFTQDDLVKMAQQGRLSTDDLVRIETKDKWYKASSVKGLKFASDDKPPPADEKKKKDAPDPSTTSATATNLLKGFGKKGKGSDRDDSAPVDSWEAREQASSKANLMQSVERKPLDPKYKWTMWACAGVILLLVVFPGHVIPKEYPLPQGRHTSFVFTPPYLKLDAMEHGTGGLSNPEIVTEDGKDYIKSPTPINIFRLVIESVIVLVVGAAVCGVFMAQKAASQIPNVKPGKPPRRKAV